MPSLDASRRGSLNSVIDDLLDAYSYDIDGADSLTGPVVQCVRAWAQEHSEWAEIPNENGQEIDAVEAVRLNKFADPQLHSTRPNIYLVKREPGTVDYDEWAGFVVVAKTPDDVPRLLKISPPTAPGTPGHYKIQQIGVAEWDTLLGEVLCDFRAG